jgi:GNAT superfamily N-acetyltransferase
MRRPGQPAVDEPGVTGLLPCAEDPRARLLVTDDRAYDALAALLPDVGAGLINVFAPATRCAQLVQSSPAWKAEAATAMICRDLGAVPAASLPSELTLKPVGRLAGHEPGAVPLEDAVALVRRADPRIEEPPELFAAFLRSLPPSISLLAAVDAAGAVRATSGSDTFGTQARVFFVNTDPAWRGRGIGQAMTAAALHAARESGARQAALDATEGGRGIYLRLGFEPVSRTTRFRRDG